jgi:hypothetical protein
MDEWTCHAYQIEIKEWVKVVGEHNNFTQILVAQSLDLCFQYEYIRPDDSFIMGNPL